MRNLNILSLKVNRYRNIEQEIINPSENMNIIYGNNAQGKTNLIEAIWLFTGGKSFRGNKDNELIKFGEKEAKLEIQLFTEGRSQDFEILIKKNKRQCSINGIYKNSIASIVGKFCSVIFSPDHLSLIKDGPMTRRKLIDAAICQIKPSYIKLLSRYNKNLNERNALLKAITNNSNLIKTIDIWNENLSILGELIVKERIKYIDILREYSTQIYKGISKDKEKFDIKYQMSFSKSQSITEQTDIKCIIKSILEDNIKTDIKLGYTQAGPHKDDLNILINDKLARNFASQGQSRSSVLAIKLSEAKILKEKTGENPVILLDDVLSELDTMRQNYIINSLSNFQVFITCCDPHAMTKLIHGKIFEMEDGSIKSQEKVGSD